MSPPKETRWEPHGFTIFCDDIREEVTGKSTYVGTYANIMYLPEGSLPVVLPALHMAVYLYHDPDEEQGTIILRVALPGQSDEQATVNIEIPPPPRDLPPETNIEPVERPRRAIIAKLSMSPHVVDRFGRVRVMALWNGKVIPLGSLVIAPAPKTPTPA